MMALLPLVGRCLLWASIRGGCRPPVLASLADSTPCDGLSPLPGCTGSPPLRRLAKWKQVPSPEVCAGLNCTGSGVVQRSVVTVHVAHRAVSHLAIWRPCNSLFWPGTGVFHLATRDFYLVTRLAGLVTVGFGAVTPENAGRRDTKRHFFPSVRGKMSLCIGPDTQFVGQIARTSAAGRRGHRGGVHRTPKHPRLHATWMA
jgi:hypothetical protein